MARGSKSTPPPEGEDKAPKRSFRVGNKNPDKRGLSKHIEDIKGKDGEGNGK